MLKIISLGGSIINPGKVDYKFLKQFREIILNYTKKGNKVIIICGGGKICRDYFEAAKKITNISKENLENIGIESTRLNAELVRSIFGNSAHPKVEYNSKKQIKFPKILVCAGNKPGASSDYNTVQLALTYKQKELINLTDINHVYNKNPKTNKNAKPINNLSWKEYKKIIGNKWTPGGNFPFDPIASKIAMNNKIKVFIAKGKDINNLKNIFNDKVVTFNGTIIGD